MKRILIIAMAICCLAVKANAQLLYKISGDSLKPSYIIASHPYINPLGVVANVSAVKDALTNTEQLVEDTAHPMPRPSATPSDCRRARRSPHCSRPHR